MKRGKGLRREDEISPWGVEQLDHDRDIMPKTKTKRKGEGLPEIGLRNKYPSS